ncbi:hypothetical protein [Cardinium endosymbiont of Sogatella furcifera]|uniref:hypothetical protein n=1 Tax=Cardinium endosymbiont of Sogatella furcifera TaxID=650378 RepID=UPI0013B38075|nr:hypothetical protein [Cardinium endosymbiont of Sogatella furcifera]
MYTGLFLHSCSAIRAHRSNITPITRQDLLEQDLLVRGAGITVAQENRPLIEELRSKLGRLRNEGFVDGTDHNNTSMKKHFMFVFYHCLRCKQSRMSIPEKVTYFSGLNDTPNLVWDLVHTREDTIEFRLKSLYDQGSDPNWRSNLAKSRRGTSPISDFGSGLEKVDIDHLLRSDRVTIELPVSLHKEKTRFIDNLTNIPKRNVTRNSYDYWRSRVGH